MFPQKPQVLQCPFYRGRNRMTCPSSRMQVSSRGRIRTRVTHFHDTTLGRCPFPRLRCVFKLGSHVEGKSRHKRQLTSKGKQISSGYYQQGEAARCPGHQLCRSLGRGTQGEVEGHRARASGQQALNSQRPKTFHQNPHVQPLSFGGELMRVPGAEIFHVQLQPKGKFCQKV